MPPRKLDTWTGNASCRGRDATPLQQYVLDKTRKRGYLASLLNKYGLLDKFGAEVSANECTFTFENSDWFGVKLQNPDGSEYFFNKDGTILPGVLYFKVVPETSPDGTILPGIDWNNITNVKPVELQTLRPCVIINNACAVQPKETPPKAPKVPKEPKETPPKVPKVPKVAPKAAPVATVGIPTEELTSSLQSLQVGSEAGPSGSTSEVSGNIAVKDIQNKTDEEIIQWMIENMKSEDIFTCLRSKTLSDTDRETLNFYQQSYNEGVVEPEVSAEILAVQASASLAPEVAHKMYKKITKDDILSELRELSGIDKKNAVANLCRRSGRDVQVMQRPGRKPGSVVYELYERGNPVTDAEIDDVLDECAEREARRLGSMLRSRWSYVMPKAAAYMRTNAPMQAPPVEVPMEAPMQAPGITKEQLMQIVESASNRKEGIFNACQVVGIPLQRSERPGRGGKTLVVYTDEKNNPIADEEWDDLLEDCIAKISNSQFGRRRKRCPTVNKNRKKPLKVSKVRSNFKCAARKCKTATNYRKCMKTELRRIYKKRKTASFGKKRKVTTGKKVKKVTKVTKVSKAVKIFKAAAKKCKGKPNYRKCMKTELRKMHKSHKKE